MFTKEVYDKWQATPGFRGVDKLDRPLFSNGEAPLGHPRQAILPGDTPKPTGGGMTPPTPIPPAPKGPTPMQPRQRGWANYDPVALMEQNWKNQQDQMQQVQMQNQQREQMIQQRRQEERYKQMMGMDLNAGLRPWAMGPQAGHNPMLAAQAGAGMSVQPLGGNFNMSAFGGQAGMMNPLGGLPSWSPPPVPPIQMLGVPGRFGETQTSGRPSHVQAGQFFNPYAVRGY